ncbi:MAG: (deoxy)nucleoside triphosphate pyrophosphohydrolase [Bacteroidales bacterium]
MTEVTCAIILRDNHVLITQRSEKMPHPLKWEFPGGKVKEGESVEECIRREIREELGLHVKVDRLLPSVRHSYGNYPIVLIPLVCTVKDETVTLAEHKAYQWISLEEMEGVDWLEADLGVVRLIRERL